MFYLLHVSGVLGTWEGLGWASGAPSRIVLLTLTLALSIWLLHSVFEISLSHCPPSPSPSWVVLSLFSSYRLHDRSASTWNNKALNVVFIPSAAHQRVICTLLPCFHVIRQISKEKFRNWVSDQVLEIHTIIAWPSSNFCLKDCFFILQFLVHKRNSEPDSDYG